VPFLDGGNVWLRNRDVDLSEMKFSAGLGLRYNTPVGPLRLDYGFKLDREPGESKGEFHFSIGHAF
jgi:outer membrane protein insertion porin family